MSQELLYEISMNSASPEALSGFIIQQYRIPIEEQLKQKFVPCLVSETVFSSRKDAYKDRVILRTEFLCENGRAVVQKNYLINVNNGQSNFENGTIVKAVSELSDTQQCSEYLHFLGLVQTEQKIERGLIIRGPLITAQLSRRVWLPAPGSVEDDVIVGGTLDELLSLDDTNGSKLELRLTQHNGQNQ